MNRCKTCKYWAKLEKSDTAGFYSQDMCEPLDPANNYAPMDRGFECRVCKMPTQTFAESPVQRDGFGLVDASQYFAALVTAEDFGCVKHSAYQEAPQEPR